MLVTRSTFLGDFGYQLVGSLYEPFSINMAITVHMKLMMKMNTSNKLQKYSKITCRERKMNLVTGK